MTLTIPKKQMSPLAVVEGANRNNLCEKTSFRSFISFPISLFVHYFYPFPRSDPRFVSTSNLIALSNRRLMRIRNTKRYLEVIQVP